MVVYFCYNDYELLVRKDYFRGIVMASNYSDTYDGIASGQKVDAQKMTDALNRMEQAQYRENALSGSAEKYPSSKAVHDYLHDLHFFPLGTILMYDGTDWEDNVTLVGWYACTAANATRGCPNLQDRFIKGAGSLNNTGGNNALTSAMLPRHSHSLGGSTGQQGATTSGGMSPDTSSTGWFKVNKDGGGMGSGGAFTTSTSDESGGSWGANSAGTTTWWRRYSMNIAHTHSVPAHSHDLSGSVSSDNSSTPDTNNNNMPAYYSVIYIRKCA